MSPQSETRVSRRLLLQLAGGALVLPGLAAGAPAPLLLLDAYRRMRYSADDRLSYWWMRATKYGLVDTRLTPLFGMEIGNIARARTLPEGGFAATSLEIVFFTDLASGERTERIRNPYTGEMLARQDSLVGPTTVDYTAAGPRYPGGLPGVTFDIRPSQAIFAVEGDDVWLRDDNAATVTPLAPGAPRFELTDWATYHASRADLANPALASVPGTVTFGSVTSWIDWMKMAGQPGNMMSRASGRKFERLEQLPESFLGYLRERYPELLRDPAAALDKPAFSFSP